MSYYSFISTYRRKPDKKRGRVYMRGSHGVCQVASHISGLPSSHGSIVIPARSFAITARDTSWLQDNGLRNVWGENAPLQRFLLEEGFKPAIFGSYRYDPVKQEFERKNITVTGQVVNGTYILSTVMGDAAETTTVLNTSTTEHTEIKEPKKETRMRSQNITTKPALRIRNKLKKIY